MMAKFSNIGVIHKTMYNLDGADNLLSLNAIQNGCIRFVTLEITFSKRFNIR